MSKNTKEKKLLSQTISKHSKIHGMPEYLNEYKASMAQPQKYWSEIIKNYHWYKLPEKICTGDFNKVDVKWFEDGTLNITDNVLDRHLETNAEKVAIYFEPNDPSQASKRITYKDLHRQVCQTAELLKSKGIQKGDVVCLYMSMIPELLISVLACARIGAIHTVVFGGFSAKALADRIADCKGFF